MANIVGEMTTTCMNSILTVTVSLQTNQWADSLWIKGPGPCDEQYVISTQEEGLVRTGAFTVTGKEWPQSMLSVAQLSNFDLRIKGRKLKLQSAVAIQRSG